MDRFNGSISERTTQSHLSADTPRLSAYAPQAHTAFVLALARVTTRAYGSPAPAI